MENQNYFWGETKQGDRIILKSLSSLDSFQYSIVTGYCEVSKITGKASLNSQQVIKMVESTGLKAHYTETSGGCEISYFNQEHLGDLTVTDRNGDTETIEIPQEPQTSQEILGKAVKKLTFRSNLMRKHENLTLNCLTPAQHLNTCGYWYTVTIAAVAHTAFASQSGLNRWLSERGLTLSGPIPDNRDEFVSVEIAGTYYDNMTFGPLPSGPEIKILSNGEYTLATITLQPDGSKIINYHNPNVENRIVYDYATSKKELDSDPSKPDYPLVPLMVIVKHAEYGPSTDRRIGYVAKVIDVETQECIYMSNTETDPVSASESAYGFLTLRAEKKAGVKK